MHAEFEVAWHGATWRDDRVDVAPPESVGHPQGLSPTKRPNERRGGRKPIIATAVAETLRTAEKPLSTIEVHARIQHGTATVAGVHSAMYRLQRAGQIKRAERRTGFGEFSATYRWVYKADAPKTSKAEIGRLGGLKAAEVRRNAAWW